MKRDMDVIRKLVLTLRDTDKPVTKVEGLDSATYLTHAQLLIEAGLAEGSAAKTINGHSYPASVMLTRLTWQGHDFADSVMDDTLWKKAKENVIKPSASWTFGILAEWIKMEAKSRLGLP